MSLPKTLKSQLFSELPSPQEGQEKRPSGRVGLRTLRVLYDEFPAPLQPKMIAARARVSYEAVKKWLQRSNGRHVVNVGQGWYRARATLQLLKRIGFDPLHVHSIKIKVPRTMKSLAGGGTPRIGGLGREVVRANGAVERVGDWRGRQVTVQAMANGGSYVSIRASTNPISCEEFVELAAWIDGLSHPEAAVVDDFDLNIDAEDHRFKMSGVQSMQIGDWTSAYVKAYNKECLRVGRIETCYHRLNANMSEMARVLHEITSVPPMAPEASYRPELLAAPSPWEVA